MPSAADKLQICLTVSDDSHPELLAYLRQFRNARERAMMLKLLAQRGLQLVSGAGPDSLLAPPATAVATEASAQAPLQRQASPPAESGLRSVAAPANALVPDEAQPVGYSPSARPPPPQAPVATDTLRGLDIGALNDAMARFG